MNMDEDNELEENFREELAGKGKLQLAMQELGLYNYSNIVSKGAISHDRGHYELCKRARSSPRASTSDEEPTKKVVIADEWNSDQVDHFTPLMNNDLIWDQLRSYLRLPELYNLQVNQFWCGKLQSVLRPYKIIYLTSRQCSLDICKNLLLTNSGANLCVQKRMRTLTNKLPSCRVYIKWEVLSDDDSNVISTIYKPCLVYHPEVERLNLCTLHRDRGYTTLEDFKEYSRYTKWLQFHVTIYNDPHELFAGLNLIATNITKISFRQEEPDGIIAILQHVPNVRHIVLDVDYLRPDYHADLRGCPEEDRLLPQFRYHACRMLVLPDPDRCHQDAYTQLCLWFPKAERYRIATFGNIGEPRVLNDV